MLQYIIYCRKSSESEERQVLSIESQIKELNELAKKLSLSISETLTESQSAKSPGRPIFNEMMKKIYAGQFKGIICWKLDRLARNPIDGSALVWALDQGKISEIITPHGNFLNNSNDKFLMQLEFGMAKKYVDDLSDNVKRGNRAKLERGWLPGTPPLGYLTEPREKIIIKDPERFHLVRKMWDLLLQGIRPSKIVRLANEEWGFRTRPYKRLGNKPLNISGIYKLFSNPFYFGVIERKEGVYQGKHEPMMSEEEYWKAQEILGRKGRPRPQKHNFAFTGLIRCAECGSMITADEKTNRYGYHYIYYRCTKKKRNTICNQKHINLKDLEPQILDYLSKIYVPEQLLDLALEYLKEEEKEDDGKYLDVRQSVEKALSNCHRKIDNLNQMRLNDLINDKEYLQEKKNLLHEKIKLEGSLSNKNANGNARKASELTKKALIFANHGRDRFQNGSLEDKRSMLEGIKEIGSNFSLRDRKLIIEAEKPLLTLEEGLKAVNEGVKSLEPLKCGSGEPKNGLSSSQILCWHATIEDVRTFYREKETCGACNSRRH